MSRSRCFVLGVGILVAAAPTRGQGLLEAFVEGFNEGGYSNDNDNHHHHHDGSSPHGNTNTHYHQVWDGDHWDYVPHTVPSRPSGNVVYPSYPNGNVVYPSTTTVVSPATTVTTAVVPNALPYKGPGVTIVLEDEVGGAVNYIIDGKESAMIQAGQQQTLTAKGKYEIRFSRGKSDDGRDFGQARYTITEGNYHFTVTDKGWELLRDKEQPNLVTAQVQPASPAGIKTNALPPKNAVPAAPTGVQPAAPAASSPTPASPAPNALPPGREAKAATTEAAAAPAAGG